MREDFELCTYFKFHKHKIIFFLSAMRAYAEELKGAGFQVHYEKIDEEKKFSKSSGEYERALTRFLKEKNISQVLCFQIEDRFFEKRIQHALKSAKVDVEIFESPMFLCSRDQIESDLGGKSKLLMRNFYEKQRKRLGILIDSRGEPRGGKWSFDEENREALPQGEKPPEPHHFAPSEGVQAVSKWCDKSFKNHPGSSENFYLPVDRKGARKWFKSFLEERFEKFGPYEDALSSQSDFVYHSFLTPFLNTGLITPREVVDVALDFAEKFKVPLPSLEGFLRQIIGWREFIHGIYLGYGEKQIASNFFRHKRKLTEAWYTGRTGIAPLDEAIKKVVRLGYLHHIERLMVVGSLMLLLEVHPDEAYRWFMEMFIDSSDWVMVPNVYGMALFADGGIFATKPYFCGSNYYRKMGGYSAKEPWCDAVDGLYWGFINTHKEFFSKNPRLSMMVRTLDKMDAQKKKRIFQAATELKNRITHDC
jgi:deoxyribodipyrimidine photolyase-related protein